MLRLHHRYLQRVLGCASCKPGLCSSRTATFCIAAAMHPTAGLAGWLNAGAELIKPAKAAPATLPQEALPAPRGPKKAKAAAAKAAAPPAPAKRAGSAASSASSGIRLVGEKQAGWSTVGQPKGAGAAARIFGSKGPPGGGGGVPGAARSAQGSGGASSVIPPGVPRPVELQVGAGPGPWLGVFAVLGSTACCCHAPGRFGGQPGREMAAKSLLLPLQMCQDFLDCGECFTYNCPRAHDEVGAVGRAVLPGPGEAGRLIQRATARQPCPQAHADAARAPSAVHAVPSRMCRRSCASASASGRPSRRRASGRRRGARRRRRPPLRPSGRRSRRCRPRL